MKNRNRYRDHFDSERAASTKVKVLEVTLSIKDRLFSLLALRRGLRRLRKWAIILLIILPILAGIIWAAMAAVEKAYSLSIDKISYDARLKLISKENAMRILGIEGSINMASLDTSALVKKLESDPCIESVHIHAELPDTLHIEVNERIPVVYVEQESGTDTGNRQRFFMDPNGKLFPVVEEYHSKFNAVPVWYLQPGDVEQFAVGATVDTEHHRYTGKRRRSPHAGVRYQGADGASGHDSGALPRHPPPRPQHQCDSPNQPYGHLRLHPRAGGAKISSFRRFELTLTGGLC